jgi:hypothetical protein
MHSLGLEDWDSFARCAKFLAGLSDTTALSEEVQKNIASDGEVCNHSFKYFPGCLWSRFRVWMKMIAAKNIKWISL